MILSNSTDHKLGFIEYFSLCALLLYAIGNFNDVLFQISLWILIPLSAVSIFCKTQQVFFNSYLKHLFALYLWSAVTALTAYDIGVATEALKRFLVTFTFSYVVAYLSYYYKSSYILALIYIAFFLNCVYYAETHILAVRNIDENFRLGDDRLNSNLFGYFLFFITFIVYHLGIISRHKRIKIFWDILFIALIPTTFWIAILTASRQILILQIPYFVILLYLRYWNNSSWYVKLIVIIISIIVFFELSNDIINTYQDSNLYSRSKGDVAEDSRLYLLKDAIEIGINNPFMGVGPDNFRLFSTFHDFSHNSFAELFANSGIIATIIYSIMLFSFLMLEFSKWRHNKSIVDLSFFIFGIFYIIDNFFYVFYLNPWLIGMFIFVASLSVNNGNRFATIRIS